MFKHIAKELKRHAPFTIFGAITGIILMFLFYRLPSRVSYNIFYTLHPIHVVLSALVTASMYKFHSKGKVRIWILLLIGYVGSIGIATISDIFFPYLGGVLLGAKMEFHLGFIEKWWLINPLALLGIALGYWRPATKIPHSGHVLISTWASLFYLTAFGVANWLPLLPLVFLVLFFAVWIPCCVSDIVFPLLFVHPVRDE
ncbi:hypothetical protein L6386_03275 [bacterium]|nr:hypothetical protein [bacterium]